MVIPSTIEQEIFDFRVTVKGIPDQAFTDDYRSSIIPRPT